MIDKFLKENYTDTSGNPAGGIVRGVGLSITWQDGPLGKVGTPDRKEPNGAFVETVLVAVKQRLEYYQNSKFATSENQVAIVSIDAALAALHERTVAREKQGIEGTHAVHTPVAVAV